MNTRIFCRLVFIFFLALTVCPAQAVDKGPKGVARVGVFPFEPLNFIDEKGVAQGLYPDLLREIVKDEKWAVEFVPGSWAEGLERLQRGEIDLILSVAYSPERAESMDFTFESVAELWGQVFFKPNSKLKNINSLEGHRVAIMSKDISGSNFIATAEKLGVHCEIVEFPTHGKVFAAVQEGKVDAGVAPQHFGQRHAREFNLIGSSIIFSPFSIYFASKKGTQHELLSHIDAHLSSWKKEPNSFYYERIDSWLGNRSLKTKIPTWLIYVSIFGTISILAFAAFSLILKRTVNRRTKELQESEERMRLFFERQIVGMAITSPEKGWIQVNDRLIQMLGYSREELACRTWEELTHPEDIATDLDQFNRLLSGEIDEYSMGKRFIRKNGSVIFTNISIGCVRGADRSVTFILALLEDITERKRAEENLRESEVRYRMLFQDANDGIALADAETGQLVDCNQALCRMVERDKGELVGKPQSILHPPAEIGTDKLSQTFRRHLTENLQQGLEDHLLSKSGKILTVDIRASRIRIGGHEFLLGIFRDITERKQTEEDLRSKDKQLTEITSRLPCLVFQFIAGWDGSRTVSYVNGQVEKMLGLAPDPQGFFERFTAAVLIDQRSDFINIVEKTVREVAEWKYEGPIAKPSGEIIWISGIASPTETSEGIVYDGVIVDITEPKLAEEALRESEQRHREYIENTPFGVFVANEQGQYLQVNPAACRITGYTEEELLAMSIPDLLFKETLAEDILHFQTLVREGKSQCEIRFCPKNGEKRWWSVTAVKISDKLFLGFCNDISDRKFAEEERANLEAENRQLQKAESLGLMAGAIAHHINNQLGAVIGNLEMTLEDLPQGSEMVKRLTSAMKASRQAAEIGSQMLTYLGQSTGIRELLDLSETCRQSLPLLQAAVPHDLIFKVDLPSPGPTISANANQLQQVLTNLVTNAWEAIADNKGTLGLTVKMASPAEKSAANKFPNGWRPEDGTPYACLEVIDTGCGISRAYIEKIFDPFFSTKFTGRGLGLPVVLGIVKTHHGAVTVESEMGRGSTFRVLLPVSAEELPRQLETVQPLATNGSGTVLLVDDEDLLREMAAAMLMRLGYTVLAAKDGVEAMKIFDQHQDEIRCVVSDLTMPRMNGWQTLAALRKLSPGIPVILSSGYDEAQVLIGDHPELPQAFLHKPYQMAELQAALAKAMAS